MQKCFDNRTQNLMMPKLHPIMLVELLEELGISENDLNFSTKPVIVGTDPFMETIEYTKYKTLIEEALILTGDRHLGLKFGRKINFTGNGLLGLAALSAKTFREALGLFNHYTTIIAPFLFFDITQSEHETTINIEPNAMFGGIDEFIIETAFSVFYYALKHNHGSRANEMKIYTTVASDETIICSFNQILPGVKYQFNCADNRISMPNDLLDLPLPMANETTVNMVKQRLDKHLRMIEDDKTSLVTKVRDILLIENCNIGFDDIAERLFISPRTFNRRLNLIGTSYKTILQGVRKKLAIHHLNEGRMSIAEISDLLGYSNPSNFGKAFKGWTGLTPSDFRTL